MAPSFPKLVVLPLLFLCILPLRRVSAQLHLDDSSSAASLDPFLFDDQHSLLSVSFDDTDEDAEEVEHHRRWLFWKRAHLYISYAAMSANRVPCRPRSGRSYYNHNCNRLSGPVHPYFRSCSAITRCRR